MVNGRIVKFWGKYFEMILIFKIFLKVKRIGNQELYLKCV